jgi:hypothetical protein
MTAEAKRLVVCCSPLQAYLWLIIARQEKISDARVLYITSGNTIKDKYYFNELRAAFQFVEYVNISGRIWQSVRELRERMRAIAVHSKCDELHIASFNTFFSMYIFKICNPSEVILYDDGVFSIISEFDRDSYRFNLSVFSLFKRIAFRLVLGVQSDQHLIDRVSKFNTIFPDHQSLVSSNLINPIILENPSSKPSIDVGRTNQVVRIFIGDVHYELSQEMKKFYEEITNKLEFDYYLPHPRSKGEAIAKQKIVLLPTIAEEFIIKLLNEGKLVTIYSFSSTVLFTIGQHFGLKKVMLFHPAMPLPSLYDKSIFFGIVRANFNVSERRLIAID